MNRRYRRQMWLRSRAHRHGEPIGCGCHRRCVTIDLGDGATVTIREPSLAQPPPTRGVHSLPDLSTYEEVTCSVSPT